MTAITGRVLSLPSAVDVREEATRAGVAAGLLGAFATGFGAEVVKLSGIAPSAVAAIRTMIAVPAGLVVVYPSESEQAEQGDAETRRRGDSLVLPGGEDRGEVGAQAAEDEPPPYGITGNEGVPQHPTPNTQHPAQSSVLLAGSRPLLVDVASRLEDSAVGDERTAGKGLRLTLERYDRRGLGTTRWGNLAIEWGQRTYVMGIVNVTPNSFSGDGLGTDVDAAVEQGLRFIQEGADILDVGGESTRPGFEAISDEEEIARVVPVISRLARETSAPISVDTYKVEVARRALDAGATILNDIWGLRHDPTLAKLAAEYDTPIVLMHNRRAVATRTDLGGHVKTVEYSDLMGEVVDDLRWSVETALQHGVKLENIVIDPGIGFGKTPQHNIVVMRRQREMRSLGRPVLMGTSRKSFIGLTLGLPVDDRIEGTGATVALSIVNGADIVRVHDVKQMARVSRMTDAIIRPVMSNG